jgi:aminoglycoside 6'-N-acetyltransferase I
VGTEDGAIEGFASVSIRPWVEGVDAMPCPHLEGWFVKAGSRQNGAGRALILAVEQWCRQRGFHILTSDTGLSNDVSLRAHKALGFTPTEQIQYFKKSL